MYFQAKDWLLLGGIDPDDSKLENDLVKPGFHIQASGKLVLESKADMKKRGVGSPDDGDAFVLTFARKVALTPPPPPPQEPQPIQHRGMMI